MAKHKALLFIILDTPPNIFDISISVHFKAGHTG